MWFKGKIRKMLLNDRGSFTVEASFVMVIILGIIISILFMMIYCFERVCLECDARNNIKYEEKKECYQGQLGKGEWEKAFDLDIMVLEYKLGYYISVTYPFTEKYIENSFTHYNAVIRSCERKASDMIRMYDVTENRGG
ncbi:hypothetical protein [[Clostridium] polysaccharolyticum]|uniref:TadE-like protein n=1 Tax=[Clostridium] polysaccharolyticum TaxID=29364 RepID=A0A1I0D9J5_9FIRM|nr:hypothetical protein [[Clostridium] polysaccharolyticum]SET28960.1 hypothetical protein SAMN04487772_11370 [[Clostridium] polysaccharolyticum]